MTKTRMTITINSTINKTSAHTMQPGWSIYGWRRWKPEGEGMRIGGSCNWKEFGVIQEMVSDAPAITRYHPRYHLRFENEIASQISSNEIPSQLSSLCRPPQKLNSPQGKKNGFPKTKISSGSMCGQNWKSVSCWNLSLLSFISVTLSNFPIRLAMVVHSVKRIWTQMSMMIDTNSSRALK